MLKLGSKEDNVGFARSPKDKNGSRGDKRKAPLSPSPAQSDSETVTKKKRQRKSRQKKEKNPPESPAKGETPVPSSNSVHTADGSNTAGSKTPPGSNNPGSKTPPGFNNTGSKTPPGSKAKNGSRATVYAPGGAMAVQKMATTSDDEALLPKVSSIIVDSKSFAKDEATVLRYFPRSITKGIGFVPVKKSVGANEGSGGSASVGPAMAAKATSSGVSSSLDVLASVSASLWTSGGLVPGNAEGKRAMPEESATTKAPKKRRERPKKEKKSAKGTKKEAKTPEVAAVLETGKSNGFGKSDENMTTNSFGGVLKIGKTATSCAGANAGAVIVKCGDATMSSIDMATNDEVTASPGSVAAPHDKPKSKDRSISDVESASFAPLSVVENRNAKKSKNGEQPLKRKGNVVKISRKNLGGSSQLGSPTKEAAKAMSPRTKQNTGEGVFKKEQASGSFSFVSADDPKEAEGIDDNCIVFVNDRSIDNIMTIEEIDDNEDNVFNKCLLNRKRQHSQRLNNTRLKSGSNEQDKATLLTVSEQEGKSCGERLGCPHVQRYTDHPYTVHLKISPGRVTRMFPEKCLNSIVIMREQHCWTNTVLFIFVSTKLLSNDKATESFMAVGTGKVCIDKTTIFPVVDMPVSTF